MAFQFKEGKWILLFFNILVPVYKDDILSLYIDTLNTCIGSITSGRLSAHTVKVNTT